MSTRDHERYWAHAPSEGSTVNHTRMPIYQGGSRWAMLEVSFAPIRMTAIMTALWERPSTRLILAMGVLGFLANMLFLKRVLRHLDPSEVVPARVQTALDVMTNGVLLVDANQRIVLANSAFCRGLNRNSASLLGMPAGALPWEPAEVGGVAAELPWLCALEEGESRTDVPISIRPDGEGERLEFRVSGSPVLDGWNRAKGAIVTFQDVTQLERQRRELEAALTELGKSQDEIRLQNEELELLAKTDSLTGLANRRTFMAWYDEQFEISSANHEPLCCLMVDIDFFKKVNDEHGHAMGDEVICRVADVLRDHRGSTDLAGRYGGEEFCMAYLGVDIAKAVEIAEKIRATIAGPGFARIPVTVSIGVSSTEFGARNPAALLEEADQSLYASKNHGRNRVTRFDEIESLETGANA